MAYPDKNEMPDLSRRAFINGQTVAFEPNDTILEAARRAGIFIPTLCELAALNHRPGTCRVCLVEVELPQGGREIVTSCETKIEPGMRIRTRTAEVRRRQKMQVELLMADHDENCSSCKRHGKCGLQDAALWTGADRLGLSGRYKPIRKLDMSAPAMRFDGGKCIAACAALKSAGKCRVFRRFASPERARKPKSALPALSIGGHPIDALNAGSARSFARRGLSACVIKGAMSSTCSTTIQSPRSFSLRLLCEWRFLNSSACSPSWMCRARSSVL